MDNETLIKKLRDTELEILDVIHSFCMQNNIRYSLAFGTLLGAVRHQGFIPWDDDIDLSMPRDEYDRFISLWLANPPQGYVLQNIETNPDFTQNFTKIRKDHTAFLQDEFEKALNYHKGVFVDIFPVDKVPDGKISRKFQYACAAIAMLYARKHTSGSGGKIEQIERMLLKTKKSNYPKRRRLAERWIMKWNGNAAYSNVIFDTIGDAKKYFKADVFESLVECTFESKKYLRAENYDAVLTALYGDYMQLPPEEERVWTHHPIIVDFEHNYEEISE